MNMTNPKAVISDFDDTITKLHTYGIDIFDERAIDVGLDILERKGKIRSEDKESRKQALMDMAKNPLKYINDTFFEALHNQWLVKGIEFYIATKSQISVVCKILNKAYEQWLSENQHRGEAKIQFTSDNVYGVGSKVEINQEIIEVNNGNIKQKEILLQPIKTRLKKKGIEVGDALYIDDQRNIYLGAQLLGFSTYLKFSFDHKDKIKSVDFCLILFDQENIIHHGSLPGNFNTSKVNEEENIIRHGPLPEHLIVSGVSEKEVDDLIDLKLSDLLASLEPESNDITTSNNNQTDNNRLEPPSFYAAYLEGEPSPDSIKQPEELPFTNPFFEIGYKLYLEEQERFKQIAFD
ncbi:hypothetical protein L3V79_07460 [Thiotrichales bacterium 19S9-12]|nr:hypothetical protein [Thiotrichales bacterium 19S9-11]MCF6812189.1 hypothetical protein [Thiotrichales bacterium 19S9-12]